MYLEQYDSKNTALCVNHTEWKNHEIKTLKKKETEPLRCPVYTFLSAWRDLEFKTVAHLFAHLMQNIILTLLLCPLKTKNENSVSIYSPSILMESQMEFPGPTQQNKVAADND